MTSNNVFEVLSDIIFVAYDYSPQPSGTSVSTSTSTLVESGEIISEAEAEALFLGNLSEVFSESSVFAIDAVFQEGSSVFDVDGVFQGSAFSEAEIVASFSLEAGEIFSFDFLGDLVLETTEIENPDAYYSEAQLDFGFLVLDSSDLNNIQFVDYIGIEASLISSQQIADLEVIISNNFTLDYYDQFIDVDNNNGIDFIFNTIEGTYERTFDKDTNLTLLKVSRIAVELLGDPLIGNLGDDFIYGTIWDDIWKGFRQDDKFYGSLGDDELVGKNGDDIILASYGNDTVDGANGDDQLFGGRGEDLLNGGNDDDQIFGGEGHDLLNGGRGEDRLFGGGGDDRLNGDDDDDLLQGDSGDDILNGGRGNDQLTGGEGADQFLYETNGVFNASKVGVDLITDFMVNTDKIVLSQTTFKTLTPTENGFINPNEFEVVDNDELAAVSEAFITYSIGTGNLFYNQNGSKKGFGQGDQFASLQNIPTLTATDFLLI